jgi:hypothetical protein
VVACDARLTVVPIGRAGERSSSPFLTPAARLGSRKLRPLRGAEPLVLFDGMTGLAEGSTGFATAAW